jgi:hypothetical protein
VLAVAHLFHPWIGGTERQALKLARTLVDQGIDVRIVTLPPPFVGEGGGRVRVGQRARTRGLERLSPVNSAAISFRSPSLISRRSAPGR